MSHLTQEPQKNKKSTKEELDQKNEGIDNNEQMEEDVSDHNSSLVDKDSNSFQGTILDIIFYIFEEKQSCLSKFLITYWGVGGFYALFKVLHISNFALFKKQSKSQYKCQIK